MRVAVVGSTGNVGSALIRRLVDRPSTEVIGVSRRLPTFTGPFTRVDSRSIDVSNPTAGPRLDAAFEGVDAVVNLAWALQPNHDERAMRQTNVVGLGRVLDSAARMGVRHVVAASSVGAYSVGPKTRRVDESWPTGGIPSSQYARQKAQCERALDTFDAEHPDVVVTRLRPGLVMNRDAASEMVRLFAGPHVPLGAILRLPLPFVPLPRDLIAQVVDAGDLADAVERILTERAGGAFNIAADPPIGPQTVAAALSSRWLPVTRDSLRSIIRLTWRARLQASDPGWLDLATATPLMSTERIRSLGWVPRVNGVDALNAVLSGIKDGTDLPASPQLRR